MTHFPQPHPTKRAARVQLGGTVLAAIRFDDGQRSRAKLFAISVTGGLLKLAKPMSQGDFVEIGFQTKVGSVIGMAEMLPPTRKATDGILQPTLHNIRKLAAVTSYGGSRFKTILMGDPPRRHFKRSLRLNVRPGAPATYLALYDMNRATDAGCGNFLTKVGRVMRAF